jgi:hypothetical protein
METAADVIVDAAEGHGVEGLPHHAEESLVGIAVELEQEQAEAPMGREFRRRTESPVP